MRINMVLFEPQELGGLEEIATTLAISLRKRGLEVRVLSTTWVSPENQYLVRLRQGGVTYIQPPKFLSHPAWHWPTKNRILDWIMWFAKPVTLLMAAGIYPIRRCSWKQAKASSEGWLRFRLMAHIVGPDRRESLGRLFLNWWYLRWRPDLVHIHGYERTLLFAIDWAHSKKIPVVYEAHQTPDTQFDFQDHINKADTVVAVSDTSAQALRTICGVTRPIVVSHPPLPDPIASGWRKKGHRPQSDSNLNITTVARLTEVKGLTYLIEAIARVKRTHPHATFRVYGDGELRAQLIAYANQLGLEGIAIFPGPYTSRDELIQIMDHTDIFVISSILEGQPLGVVEAMAYGCPIVTTAVGGIPEIVTDGVNGLLCPPKDSECLAAKIRALLDDPALRSKLGLEARLTYESGPFQPASASDHFVEIYCQTIETR